MSQQKRSSIIIVDYQPENCYDCNNNREISGEGSLILDVLNSHGAPDHEARDILLLQLRKSRYLAVLLGDKILLDISGGIFNNLQEVEATINEVSQAPELLKYSSHSIFDIEEHNNNQIWFHEYNHLTIYAPHKHSILEFMLQCNEDCRQQINAYLAAEVKKCRGPQGSGPGAGA